jgi:hypothetical protein
VAQTLMDVIVTACTFPYLKQKKTSVFTVSTLNIQKEDVETEEKLRMVKVLIVPSTLRTLIIKYQSRELVFPTHLLPMKVSFLLLTFIRNKDYFKDKKMNLKYSI